MSLLDCWIDTQRALVATDTRALLTEPDPTGELSRAIGIEPGQTSWHTSKMLVLPSAHCVLALRGSPSLLAALFSHCLSTPDAHFDLLKAKMPWSIAASMDSLTAFLKSSQGPGAKLVGSQEVLLAGWSQRANAPGAVLFVKPDTDAAFNVEPDDDWNSFATPWADGWGVHPNGDSPEAMLALAREQARRQALDTPGYVPFGGRLLVAEITRKRVAISELCDDL